MQSPFTFSHHKISILKMVKRNKIIGTGTALK